ncbi:MAG: NAD(+)/NADH kinase [Elusimicrobia bacterium]|nr:NAD(+)/NADH kinase [Elusimicrobiota bacterium]
MAKNFVVYVNENKKEALEILDLVRKKSPDFAYKETSNPSSASLAFSIGGDGTVLRAARDLAGLGIPLVHINTGTLGFLGSDYGDMDSYVSRIFKGNFHTEDRMMIRAVYNDKEYIALNDIVIKNGSCARVIELGLEIDGESVADIKGDGVIISTPTGSTAYSLAAGGPVSEPSLELIILTPLNPHSLSFRPILLDLERIINVKILSSGEGVILTADGQVSTPLDPSGEILVSIYESRLKLAQSDRSFFSVLSDKMGWGT